MASVDYTATSRLKPEQCQAFALVIGVDQSPSHRYTQSAFLVAETLEQIGVYWVLLTNEQATSAAIGESLRSLQRLAKLNTATITMNNVAQFFVYFAGKASYELQSPIGTAAHLSLLNGETFALTPRLLLPGVSTYHTLLALDLVEYSEQQQVPLEAKDAFPQFDIPHLRPYMATMTGDTTYSSQSSQWLVLPEQATESLAQLLHRFFVIQKRQNFNGCGSVTTKDLVRTLNGQLGPAKLIFNPVIDAFLKTDLEGGDYHWIHTLADSAEEAFERLRQSVPLEIADIGGRVVDTLAVLPSSRARVPLQVLLALFPSESELTLQTSVKQMVAAGVLLPCASEGLVIPNQPLDSVCYYLTLVNAPFLMPVDIVLLKTELGRMGTQTQERRKPEGFGPQGVDQSTHQLGA